MPSASVVIVARNEEKTLPKLLAMLERQTYRDLELVFIDNMSTDSTPRIVEEFARTTRIPVKYERREGTLGSLYNRGIDLASGKHILIIGGDEIPVDHWVEGHVSCLERGCDACLAPVVYTSFDGENNWVEEWYYMRSLLEIIHNSRNVGNFITFNSGNTSFKGRVLRRLRFNPALGISEDGDLGYRFIKAGYKLCFNPEPLAFHPAPDSLRKHVSYWWKLAHAQNVLLKLHPGREMSRLVYISNLLGLVNPLGIAAASGGKWSKLPKTLALNITAFATLMLTHLYLLVRGGSEGIGANVQRIK